MARKVFLVFVIKWEHGESGMVKNDRLILAIIGIFVVLVASTLIRPYKSSLYDGLQTVITGAELTILVFSLGISLSESPGPLILGADSIDAGLQVSGQGSTAWIEGLAIFVLVTALAISVTILAVDLRHHVFRVRRIRALRKSTTCVLSEGLLDFDLFGGLVGAYLTTKQLEGDVKALSRFREVELLLLGKLRLDERGGRSRHAAAPPQSQRVHGAG